MELTLKIFKNAKSLVVVLLLIAAVPLSAQNTFKQSLRIPDTVFVALPTGERETDRASILSALKEVMPGGTIQFAPGTYLIGEAITVTKPQITIVGHPEGSIIRGCDSAKFGDKAFAVDGCNGFNLTAGTQSVRRLTFENTWHALILGGQPCKAEECPAGTLPVRLRKGGFLIEDSTFRDSQNGIRVVGQWKDPAVIRNNNFINTYHAVVINGMTAHITNNNISVPEPKRIPNTYHPGLALMIGGWEEKGAPLCDRNIIAGNRINGHPDAIAIMVFEGGNCRQNVISDNTIEISEVRLDSTSAAIYNRNTADSTVSGIPIALLNDIGFGKGIIENNLIENNRIFGAEGLAIEITGASDNQIVNNIISGVRSRNPFPGNILYSKAPEWSKANGSAIWLSSGSNGNEVINNTFKEIASAAVFIEGDNNLVELRKAGDSIRNLGSDNRIIKSIKEN